MKKTVLAGIIAFILLTISNQQMLFAAVEVNEPDIPADFSDAAKWPFTHTESCMPAGKEYHSTVYARIVRSKITDDKNIDFITVSSLNGIIFHYGYTAIDNKSRHLFSTEFIRSEKSWIRFNLLDEELMFWDQFEKYLVESNNISLQTIQTACQETFSRGFNKFWNELFKEAGIR